MSVEQLSQRLQDLHFSLEEQIKTYKAEQDDYDHERVAWENEEPGADHPDHEAWVESKPELVDHDNKINVLEKVKDLIDEAIDALDAALED